MVHLCELRGRLYSRAFGHPLLGTAHPSAMPAGGHFVGRLPAAGIANSEAPQEGFGDHWTPIIMRELRFSTRAFGELIEHCHRPCSTDHSLEPCATNSGAEQRASSCCRGA